MNKTNMVKFRITDKSQSILDYYRRRYSKMIGNQTDQSNFMRALVAKGLAVLKKELK